MDIDRGKNIASVISNQHFAFQEKSSYFITPFWLIFREDVSLCYV